MNTLCQLPETYKRQSRIQIIRVIVYTQVYDRSRTRHLWYKLRLLLMSKQVCLFEFFLTLVSPPLSINQAAGSTSSMYIALPLRLTNDAS